MYVNCLHVDCRSERTEAFHDIALNVKVRCPPTEGSAHVCACHQGSAGVVNSLRQYVQPDDLTGDNKYRTEVRARTPPSLTMSLFASRSLACKTPKRAVASWPFRRCCTCS